MTKLDEIRSESEQTIDSALAKLDQQHQRKVLLAIQQYGSVTAIPASFWEEIQKDIDRATAAAIILLFYRADENTTQQIRRQGFSASSMSASDIQRYSIAAAQRTVEMTAQAASSVRKRLIETVDRRSTDLLPSGEAAKDLRESVREVFSESRRERIAITSTTDAISQGQIGATRRAAAAIRSGDGSSLADGQSVSVELAWITEEDGLVCKTCGPLHNQREEVWGLTFPNGPPGHPNCRCELRSVVVVQRSEVAA